MNASHCYLVGRFTAQNGITNRQNGGQPGIRFFKGLNLMNSELQTPTKDAISFQE
jgi:hypothetical protein